MSSEIASGHNCRRSTPLCFEVNKGCLKSPLQSVFPKVLCPAPLHLHRGSRYGTIDRKAGSSGIVQPVKKCGFNFGVLSSHRRAFSRSPRAHSPHPPCSLRLTMYMLGVKFYGDCQFLQPPLFTACIRESFCLRVKHLTH